MPGLSMNGQKGRTAMLAGLCLTIFILLLARLDHQTGTLEPSTGSGDRYVQTRGRITSRDTAGSRVIPRESSLGTVNTDDPAQRLSRRADFEDFDEFDAASQGSFGSVPSMASLDSETWNTQKHDGGEGQDPAEIKKDWEKALERGQGVVKAWKEGSKPPSKPATEWDYKQIKQYGWDIIPFDPSDSHPSEGAQVALKDVPVVSRQGPVVTRFEHADTKVVKGQQHPATDAAFEISVLLGQRAMTVIDATGPAHTTQGKELVNKKPQELVPLQHLSDFMFLQWRKVCEQKKVDPASLKYIIHDNTYNIPSRNVVRQALGGPLAAKLPEYPGVTFTPDTETSGQFSATVGSPNGYATATMLMQHPEIFGADRKIVKTVLWKYRPYTKDDFKGGPLLFMMFVLNDATTTQASGSKAPASGSKAPASGSKVPASGSKASASSSKALASGSKAPAGP